MKKLLFILLCIPIIGFGQLSVDINSGYLNLREKPNYKSSIVGKLENNEILKYAGEWNGPWIKIVKEMGHKEEGIIGWVQKDYVNAYNFKSSFLRNVDNILSNEDEGATCFIKGVEGTLMAYNKINLYGIETLLEYKETENFGVYYNNEISIKLFTLSSPPFRYEQGPTGNQCLAIINFNGKEEIIFVEFMCLS